MAIFEDSKTKKKSFHMNPQMGKALHSGSGGAGKSQKNSSDSTVPGQHKNADHEHVAHDAAPGAAHHVEVHHGGHPHGEPPMHAGHTHHTIHHPHDGGEPAVHNHENYNEAEQDMRSSMGEESQEHGDMVPGAEIAESNDDGDEQMNYGD